MRTISVNEVTTVVRQMCIEANHFLSEDMKNALNLSLENETSSVGKSILEQLQENLCIASEEMIPICRDTGMTVIFIDIGQEVCFIDGNLEEAIQIGVRQGYKDGFLRKSVVSDPFIRRNTNDNTPAIIYYNICEGSNVSITVAPKGFGSENMSRIYMLKPSDGIEGAKKVIEKTVLEAGPNACPPMVVGVGIGGTFEKCALMAKKALLRSIDERSRIPHIREMEEELFTRLNKSGIGPGGLGGKNTVFSVNIETYPTHIAGLPVAINICCHVNRHVKKTI